MSADMEFRRYLLHFEAVLVEETSSHTAIEDAITVEFENWSSRLYQLAQQYGFNVEQPPDMSTRAL